MIIPAVQDKSVATFKVTQAMARKRLIALLYSPPFIVGAVVVSWWVICAGLGPHLTPYDPYATNLRDVLRPPSVQHWFGTDRLGRDVLSRVIVGARGILFVAPLATLLGTVTGTVIGLIAGYFGGLLDEGLVRLADAFMAVPVVIIGMLGLAALGPSSATLIIVIGLVFAPIISRTVRAAVLTERDLDYVRAAQLRREGALYIMVIEILPNVMGPVVVELTVRLGYAIFATATLSFLGFGLQPPAPDWGLTIYEHYAFIGGGDWWPVLFPGFAIASLVVGVNLVSDSIGQTL